MSDIKRSRVQLMEELAMMRRRISELEASQLHLRHLEEELQEAVRNLREEKERSDAIIASIGDGISIQDTDFRILYENQAHRDLILNHAGDYIGSCCYNSYVQRDQICEGCPVALTFRDGETHRAIRSTISKKGLIHLDITSSPLKDGNGKIIAAVEVVRDITGLKRTEEEHEKLQHQLLHAQKVECMGRLAGGVAHDFSNILSAIIGYCEMILADAAPEHPFREKIEIIEAAGKKGAELTQQLLAFSRKQLLRVEAVNLNDVVRNLVRMLSRIIRGDISLELHTDIPVKNVLADASQIGQVLMNLVVNARDAMPRGGKLVIETADVRLDRQFCMTHKGIDPGDYVMLAVSDNGIGMSREVQEKIFEPFFTTKDTDKGTGLGLATAYGIVKQHNGYIYVQSMPLEGTRFRIYLPATDEAIPKADAKPEVFNHRGNETVLAVDDDPLVRRLILDALNPLGYKTLIASGAEEALSISDAYDGVIDLLLTDVILQGKNGRELAEAISSRHKGIKVVFLSGYTHDTIARHGVPDPGVVLIQKPLTPSVLATRLREVLRKAQ